MLSLKAPCTCMSVSHKCWHARLPASPRAAWFPSGVLSSIYKLCDTNSSDLSVWSSFAPFCICTAIPNGLPVLAFANSKRSHCKWIPNDSKPLLAWFERMPSAPIIFLYHLSTKTGVSLDGKSCTAGIDTTEPWLCPSNLALRSIDCIWFRVKAHLPHEKHVQYWRELVPEHGSLPVVERWLWGARKIIAGCSRSRQRCEANRFRRDRRFRCFELTKFESICLPGTPKTHVFFGHTVSTIFIGHYGDAFCTGKCGHACMFFLRWKTMALLWLWLRNQGHIWPYLPVYGHIRLIFWVILKVQLWLGLTIFSIPCRLFLINDPKKLSLTRFSHNEQK